MSHGMLVTHVGSPRPTVGFLPLHALLRKRKKSWLRIIFLDVILFKIPRGKEVVRARNALELTYDETSFVSSVKPFTTFIKMKEKAKKKDFYLSKSLARHVWEISCFPTAIISFICALDMIFRKGTIYVYCTDWLIPIYCTRDWSCFLLQYPSDCIPPSARVATVPPVGLLWAADRSAAQATPPGPLWDGRQPRGRQSPNRWPPCGSGMDLNSFYFVSLIFLLGDSFLLSHCLLLFRSRYVTQPLTPQRGAKFKIELVSEANPATENPEELSWAG